MQSQSVARIRRQRTNATERSPRRSRFSLTGSFAGTNKVRLTLLCALMFTLIGAGVFRTPPLLLMASLLLGCLTSGVLLSRLLSGAVTLQREMPAQASVGDVIGGRITVTNRWRLPLFLVHFHAGSVATKSRALAESRRKAARGLPVEPLVPLGGAEFAIPFLRPHQAVVRHHAWRLHRRGIFELGPACGGVADPLGLSDYMRPATPPREITVLPRAIKIDQLGLLGGAAGQQASRHAVVVADALDFHGARLWQPGDGSRRIHWKNTARTGQMHVVEWEENMAADAVVLLDTQASTIAGPEGDDTLEAAIVMTASIALHLLESGYQFELFHWRSDPAGGPQLSHFQARSAAKGEEVLRLLAGIEPVDSQLATLPLLAEEALANPTGGRYALAIGSTLADVQGTLDMIKSRNVSGLLGQAIILDAASFEKDRTGDTGLGSRSTLRREKGGLMTDPGVRVIHKGDSFAAALEQTW